VVGGGGGGGRGVVGGEGGGGGGGGGGVRDKVFQSPFHPMPEHSQGIISIVCCSGCQRYADTKQGLGTPPKYPP